MHCVFKGHGGVIFMSVRLSYAQFEVKGKTDIYLVAYDDEDGWFCNCPDRHYRKRECKHIREAKQLLGNVVVDEVVPETQTKLVV